MRGTYAKHHLHAVSRDSRGFINGMDCPHILCGRPATVTGNRIDEHNDHMTQARCALSGAEVLDTAGDKLRTARA
ncbi:hypothetical protein [Streptomyces sp. CAU 1734]|uniref:hypothetical protein n=1 Tax=Streptomyces sp. CAU 1734 TaxID=3140360 RepID=UPI003261CE96